MQSLSFQNYPLLLHLIKIAAHLVAKKNLMYRLQIIRQICVLCLHWRIFMVLKMILCMYATEATITSPENFLQSLEQNFNAKYVQSWKRKKILLLNLHLLFVCLLCYCAYCFENLSLSGYVKMPYQGKMTSLTSYNSCQVPQVLNFHHHNDIITLSHNANAFLMLCTMSYYYIEPIYSWLIRIIHTLYLFFSICQLQCQRLKFLITMSWIDKE